MYSRGRSEEVTGEALKRRGNRDRIVLARIAVATEDRSIPANLALAEHNAGVAAEIAVALRSG